MGICNLLQHKTNSFLCLVLPTLNTFPNPCFVCFVLPTQYEQNDLGMLIPLYITTDTLTLLFTICYITIVRRLMDCLLTDSKRGECFPNDRIEPEDGGVCPNFHLLKIYAYYAKISIL